MTTSNQSDIFLAEMYKSAQAAAKSLMPKAPERQQKITSDQIFIGAVQHAIGNGRYSATQNPYSGGNSPARPTSHAARVQAGR